MRGGRLSFALVNFMFVSTLLSCGDRAPGASPAADSLQTAGPAAMATPDTFTPASGTASVGVADSVSAPRRDSIRAPAKSAAAGSTQAKPPRKAAATAKPAPRAPRPTPPAVAPSDTPPGASPTPPTDTSQAPTQANSPLRDAYHQAPHDTVSQQAYTGWKQYNLNCSRCHGEDVQGTTIAPHLIASLKPGGPINTKELFVRTVCDGRPEKGMPAWCPLGMEMDKIEAIHAYVKGRSDGKIGPGRPAVKPEG